MKRLILVCAACAPHAANVPVDPPAPIARVASTQVAPAAPDLDDASLKAKSHDFFDAWDRHDLSAFQDTIGRAYVFFENARFFDTALVQKLFQSSIDNHAPVRSRTWRDERVYIGGPSAVFIGHAVEHVPPHDDFPAAEYDGYNTLVWVNDGGVWKVAYQQWERAGTAAGKEHWNEVFTNSIGFKKEPNQTLVDAVKGVKPGTALDLLMGQGRNALYLASQGWKVTGVDISDVGLQKAREDAAKRKLKLDAVEMDIAKYDLGKDRWDLVTLIYAGNNASGIIDRIKPSLKKGGLFVSEYFHEDSDAAKAGAGGWKTGELKALFADGYDILRDDVVDDIADWTLHKQKLVRFVARKK